jgi:glycerol-3-phosphate acyltransferase PlsY
MSFMVRYLSKCKGFLGGSIKISMTILKIYQIAGLPLFAYILGSIPWGLILSRVFSSVDIRQKGSGNIGTINVIREAGIVPGILTLAGDVLKGAFPVYLAVLITGAAGWRGQFYLSLVALSAFLGHLYPVFLKFKRGGKGVATAAGCFFVISPVACLIALLVYIMCICWFNRASVGSLIAGVALPVAVWQVTHSGPLLGCAVVMIIFIYYRHMDNIKRLLSGKEPVIWRENR